MQRVFLSLLLLTFSASLAAATTVIDMPLDELAQDSSAVVEGVVVSQITQRTKNRQVETLTTLRVTRSHKGEVPARVVIKQHSGTIDGIVHSIAGDATFEHGEEVLVFLQASPANKGQFVLMGMAATKFRIERTDDGPVVVRDTSGLSLVRRGPDGVIQAAPALKNAPLSLDAVRHTLKNALP